MTLTETKLLYLVKNPHILLTEVMCDNLTEEDCEEIHNWLYNHRMTDELHTNWLRSQLDNGRWKYRALGQMFARYATIGKGFSTVDNATRLKMKKIAKRNDRMVDE